MNNGREIIRTERLIIREVAEDDAEFILRLINTPKFHRFIADRGVRDVDTARAYVRERYLDVYDKNGYGLYAVLLHDGTTIGNCGFVRRDTLTDPDIGFAFLPEYEGKGYGIEAARSIMDYGRETLGFGRVFAITSLENHASGRLLKKLGFQFEGERRIGEEVLKVYSSVPTTAE